MFTFDAIVDQDEKIYAHGSENLPKYYRDLTNGLYEILYCITDNVLSEV